MGVDQVTVKNLVVVAVDAEKNEIHVKGPVPGAKGSIVVVKRLSENKVVPVEPQVEEVTQTEEVVTEGGQTNE